MSAPPTEMTPETTAFSPWVLIRGLCGGVVGAVVGYFAFRWLTRHGFYSLMLPGILLGLGAGLAARGRSQALGVICGAAAVGVGIFSEWMRSPFNRDPSLMYFITHLLEMDAVALKLIMMAAGAAGAYWFGRGR